MLNRLLKLYKSSSQNTPLENFTTEAFVGILEKDEELLKNFVNKILNIEGENFSIKSQVTYFFNKTKRYIDIEIKNEQTLCFLENKIDSPENKEQLEDYSKILEANSHDKIIYLRYCTRFKEGKYDFKNFDHFRWNEVYHFLEEYEKNHMVVDFREFLKLNNMGTETKITPTDINNMKYLAELLPKMEIYKLIFKRSFEENFGNTYSEPDVFKRLLNHSDFIIYKGWILGDKWSEIGVGISLREEPSFCIWIWLHESNNMKKTLTEQLKKYQFDYNPNGLTLSTIIAEEFMLENPNENIKKWFDENLIKIKKFIEETQDELQWKL